MNTGRPAVDEFFRELDARLADGDKRLTTAQKAMLKKIRPELVAAAKDDPDTFESTMLDAARQIMRIGNG